MIDPRELTFRGWADRTTPLISQYGLVPKVTDDAAWLPWAKFVIQIPAIAAVNPPDPRLFTTWQAWALFFNSTVSQLAG